MTKANGQIEDWWLGEDEARKYGFPYGRSGSDPDPSDVLFVCQELLELIE